MIKIMITLVVISMSPTEAPKVSRDEAPSLEECMQVVYEFLQQQPSKFNAKALTGGCTVVDTSDPA